MKNYLKLLLILLLYTIVVYHLIDYNNFPFSPNYQFPFNEIITAYLSSAVMAIFVEWQYRSLIKKHKSEYKRRIKTFLKTTFLSCGLFFIVVYLITVEAYSNAYYFIISFLLTMVNLVVWITLIYGKSLFGKWTTSTLNPSLTIKSGTKTYKVELGDLSHFSSINKIVTAHLTSGKDITTNFNLKELEGLLSNDFFRINRQYIINKASIAVVKSAKNHTLAVQLKHRKLEIPFIVSRYRVPHFRKWFT